MLFKDFDENAQCTTCGKRFGDLASGKVSCRPCSDDTAQKSALTTVWGHISLGLYYLFSFNFLGMFVEFLWAVQRATRTGDYGEAGRFTRILQRPVKQTSNENIE